MIHSRVSIGAIAAKLYRDLGINSEIPIEELYEWCSEALLFIGAFDQFEVIVGEIPVTNHKAKLPCGFYKLKELSHDNKPMFFAGKNLMNNYFCDDCKIPVFPSINPDGTTKDTFYINDAYIVTSFETGDICIVYLGIPTDDEGIPTVPDDVYFIKACTTYVTKMFDYREWRKGRIPDKVFQHSDREWDWYCSAARGAANMPDVQRMENIKNILIRLIPQTNQYNKFFRSDREAKKVQ